MKHLENVEEVNSGRNPAVAADGDDVDDVCTLPGVLIHEINTTTTSRYKLSLLLFPPTASIRLMVTMVTGHDTWYQNRVEVFFVFFLYTCLSFIVSV